MVRLQTQAPGKARAALCTLLGALVFLGATAPRAQDAPQIGIYGFVKAETIYDTRQVADVREGQFHLFPLPASAATDTDNWLMTAIQTRLGVRGTGAQALGANVTGVIEGDFFGGPTNDNISLFILRHAFVQLAWPTHEVLFGQYWSPLFTTPVFPGTVSFNTGAPFNPFARQPQIRLTLKPGMNLQVVGVVAGQRDAFAEIGGPKLQQQSGLPMAHLHVRYVAPEVVVGGGAYAKAIRPELTSETFTAGAVQAYLKLIQPGRYNVAAKATYGADLTDHLMTGGFVQEGDGSFVPLNVLAGWFDGEAVATPNVSLGLFAGYLRNEGAADAFAPAAGGLNGLRAPNMVDLFRVAPRIVYTAGRVRFALEVEATSALYGTGGFDETFAPIQADADERVTNVRGLFAAYYLF